MALYSGLAGKTTLPGIPDPDILLKQSYSEAFQANDDSVQRWTRWREDHEQVQKALETLPDRLTHQVVIPFGSKALVKAKLVHTNEVLTCVGDSWFVKQSAKQAVEMCGRRIKQSDKMLSDLEKERILLLNRQTLPKLEEAFPSDDTKEIIEEYDEEKEAEWREKHRNREREYRQKLADLRKQSAERQPVETEEDIFRRLEELELEEELNDELDRLHAEYDTEEGEDDEDEEEEDDEEGEADEEDNDAEDEDSEVDNGEEKQDGQEKDVKKIEVKDSLTQSRKIGELTKGNVLSIDGKFYRKVDKGRSVKEKACYGFTDGEGNEWLKVEDSEKTNSPKNIDIPTVKKTRRISFADEAQKMASNQAVDSDDSEDDLSGKEENVIRFSHSDNPSSVNSTKMLRFDATEKTSMAAPELRSPSDVYDQYKTMVARPQPKSILKKSSSLPRPSEVNGNVDSAPLRPFGSSLGLHFSDSDEQDSVPTPARDLSHLPPVLCDVKEVAQPEPLPESANSSLGGGSQRPVSRFRAARQNAKR